MRRRPTTPDELLDRARYGNIRRDRLSSLSPRWPHCASIRSSKTKLTCRRLPDGRAGAVIPGWNGPIRDDMAIRARHAEMHRAIIVSCNGYFAQLGVFSVGTKRWRDCEAAGNSGGKIPKFKHEPFAAYGQGRCW